MKKAGRNDPCPCGSGRKLKKCHGGPVQQSTQNTMSAKFPSGMPGMLHYVGFVAMPRPPEKPYAQVTGGAPGLYKVVLTLARPGQPLRPEAQLTSYENMRGDSHLAIAEPAYRDPGIAPGDGVTAVILQAQTEDGIFSLIGKPNERGFLGQVTVESIHAADAQDARTKVYRALASSLSNIAVQLDMPFSVYQSDMVELTTGNRFLSVLCPHLERPLQIAANTAMSKEFRSLAALYREALNSNTTAFQFLCYYKILEGIKKRREKLIADAKTAGQPIPRPPLQVVPDDEAEFVPWLNAIYGVGRPWDFIALQSIFVPEARGKKFNHIIDDYFRPVRDRIAHAVLDSGDMTLSADDDLDLREIGKWLCLMKCLVRHRLKSDFPSEFMPFLNEKGQYIPVGG